ncbi:MAG: AgmX/PglI C-terminal domain-containing protein [Deltaproteobacteria bacterium]|nr:AgmX/PglI C-terminal domain-containing protein [Deltaproteobacteria bacterium]
MTTADVRKPASPGLALALVIGFDLLAFLGVGAAVVLASRGPGRWFVEGGPWMYLLLLLFFAQAGAAILLSVLHLSRRVPLPLYLALPFLVLLVGVLGRVLGIEQAFEAIAYAAPDQKGAMWGMSLSIADIPRAFAFFLVSAGGLFTLAGVTAAAFTRRTPGEHLPFAGIAGGTAVVGAAAVIVLGLIESQATGLRPVLFGVVLLLCAPLLALAAPALKGLSEHEDERERAHGFALALGAALGLLLGVAGFALALESGDRSTALSAVYAAPPDQMAAMLTASMAFSRTASLLGVIATLAALFVAAPLLIFAGPGAPAFAGRHPLQLVLLLVLVGGGVGIDRLGEGNEGRRHAVLREALKSPLPADLDLPESSARLVPDGDHAILLLRGEALVPAREGAGELQGRERPNLALDASTSGTTLRSLAAGLQRDRVDGIRLLVRERPGGERLALSDERRAHLLSFGIPGELLVLSGPEASAINLGLAERIAEFITPGEDALGLMLELDGAEVRPSTTLGPLAPIPATAAGEVDRAALGALLARLKEEHPDETLVAIYPGDESSLQQVVDVLDATREGPGEAWDRALLYPDTLLVTSPLRTPAPGGRDRMSELLEAMMGRPPAADGLGDGDGPDHGPAGTSGAADHRPPTVMGSLSQEVIARVVRRHGAEFRYCYEKELQTTPGMAGEVAVKFVITSEGSVSTAKIARTTLQNERVERCLLQRFQRLRFPAPAGGGIVIVTYPFVFRTAE